MTLQDDWLKYVDEPDAFSYDHFAPLITDTEEPVDLEVAFGKLPNGAELIRRIERVREETAFTGLYHVPAREDRLDRNQMRTLAERYANSVATRLHEIGEVEQAHFIRNAPIEFVRKSSFEAREKTGQLFFVNASMDIQDDFVDFTSHSRPYFMGLEEAALFMTKVPPVTRYILDAIVDYPVDDEAYYELWRGGGRIEFCEDKTLVVLPDDYEEPR